MALDTQTIIRLREETGAPVVRVKKLLDELKDEAKVKEILMKEGFEKTAKRADRETGEGRVVTYTHHTGKVAAMVELLSETDFVAKNEMFNDLAKNFALQIVSMNPESQEDLLAMPFIKEPSKSMSDLVKEVIAKTGENVQLGRFFRLEVGK
jgi:elongation factor Ts